MTDGERWTVIWWLCRETGSPVPEHLFDDVRAEEGLISYRLRLCNYECLQLLGNMAPPV